MKLRSWIVLLLCCFLTGCAFDPYKSSSWDYESSESCPSGETLTLDPARCTLFLEETQQLTVLYSSGECSQAPLENSTCTWSTSDSAVVQVDEEGFLTAAGVGEAVVQARLGALSASCTVTVRDYLYSADELPEGLFQRTSFGFEPVLAGRWNTAQFSKCIFASELDEEAFLVLPSSGQLYIKTSGVVTECTLLPLEESGYTFNAEFYRTPIGNEAYLYSLFPLANRPVGKLKVSPVLLNGQDPDEFLEEQGLAQNGGNSILIKEFQPSDTLSVGYYEGEEYREKSFYADVWAAQPKAVGAKPSIEISPVQSGVAYTVLPFSGLAPGFYKLDISVKKGMTYDQFYKNLVNSLCIQIK